jgi:glycosyltransferase involved in cell wall biosynthesis
MKVLFLYNRPRTALVEARRRGEAPDENLYCFESVRRLGVESHFTDEGRARRVWDPVFQGIERVLSRRGERVGFNLGQALALRREFRKYDLVFATADANALPVLWLKKLGLVDVPIVYATIGLAEAFRGHEGSRVFRFYRGLLPYADRIVHYGFGEGPILRDVYGVPESKLRFVRLGADVEFFAPRNTAPEDYVLALGLDRRRDWRTFLRAVKGLETRVRLVTDPLLLRGLTWPPNVEVLPVRGMLEIRDLIARARFVVLPVTQNCYTAGTFTLLQSMAAAKAVIVSRTEAIDGGYAFAFGDELIGVPPGDMLMLRLAIKALLADPARVRRMGDAAAARVAESHPLSAYARGIVDVFEDALR